MIDAIEKRRACRSYITDEKVPKEVLERIVKAGQNAPTGCDYQSYDFVVVTNQELLAKVAKAAYDSYPQKVQDWIGNPKNIFYGAPAVIFIMPAREFREDCHIYDLGIIGNSLALAATLEGYACNQIGLVYSSNPDILGKVLDLPRGLCPLGFTIGKPSPEFKTAPKEIKSHIKYIE